MARKRNSSGFKPEMNPEMGGSGTRYAKAITARHLATGDNLGTGLSKALKRAIFGRKKPAAHTRKSK